MAWRWLRRREVVREGDRGKETDKRRDQSNVETERERERERGRECRRETHIGRQVEGKDTYPSSTYSTHSVTYAKRYCTNLHAYSATRESFQ